jgi:hypothetical protein
MPPKVFALVIALGVCAVPGFTASGVVLHVDDDAMPGGNGTKKHPYSNLPEAVAAAHAVSGDVVIKVEPGDYALAETLVIDRPLDLRGSTEQVDGDDPWPTGEVVPGTLTRVFSTNVSLAELIVVGRPAAPVLSDVTIQGFIFEGTAAGISVFLARVQNYLIADNVFRAPANFGLVSVASSGHIKGNHFSGVGTGAILNGGYPESPSNVVFKGNRAVRNTIGGALLNGASIYIDELGDELDAVVQDNDLSENVGNQGFGLRVFVLRRDLGAPGDSQYAASVHALVQGNRMDLNRIGVMIDAGFPHRRVIVTGQPSVCDARVYSGRIDLNFVGNTLTDSLLTPALVTFTRNTAALNPTMLSQFQYLHDATFLIADRDGTLANTWIDHPATDPVLGPCPGDAMHELLGNVLVYNGVAVPNGRNF